MNRKRPYDSFRTQNDQLQLDRLRTRVKDVLAKPEHAIAIPEFYEPGSCQSKEENELLQLGYQHKLLFHQNLLKKHLAERHHLEQYFHFYDDACFKLTRQVAEEWRARIEFIQTKVDLTETIIRFLEHAATDFYSFNEEYKVYCLEGKLRLLLDEVERGIITGKIGPGDFIPFIILFFDTEKKESYRLCKHLIKQLAVRIRRFLKTDIRQRYRNVLRLHFKNMDDNSGADGLFSLVWTQIIKHFNYHLYESSS